jgi:hypothetical protein
MTFCADQTRLLQRAGKELAFKLLPDAFRLWFSDHDTGCQMTIVTNDDQHLLVWRGSVWYSDIYEFNDREKTAGLQPDFAFAGSAVTDYFAAVQAAVAEREAERAAARVDAIAESSGARQASIDAVRAKLSA